MMKMKDCGGEYYVPYCSFHPKEVVVGICALCLRERLLNLVLKQGHHHTQKDYSRPFRALRRKTGISLPKVFALGSFLLRPRPDDGSDAGSGSSDRGSFASLEDSFISIKFEDNGEASWERKKKKKEDSIIANDTNTIMRQVQQGKVLVEQPRPTTTTTSLRWRKRMGQLLQVVRWKRSATGAGGGSHHVEVGRRGWMRSLTARRRTTES